MRQEPRRIEELFTVVAQWNLKDVTANEVTDFYRKALKDWKKMQDESFTENSGVMLFVKDKRRVAIVFGSGDDNVGIMLTISYVDERGK